MSVPSWPWSRSRAEARAGAVPARAAAVLLALLAPASIASAQAPPGDPNEVTNLRVRHDAGIITLAWDTPVAGADSHVVRRCALPSLRVPYYGNCVAEGVLATSWQEPVPSGDVFYLVSGVLGGVEGSIGRSFDGLLWRERIPRDCSMPEVPGPMTLTVRLLEPVEFCGSQVTVYFPDGVTYTSSACAGLTSAFLSQPADHGDHATHACVWGSLTGPSGPGTITQVVVERGECPLPRSAFPLVQCDVTDCDSLVTIPVQCEVR